jgi:hypothetical protein
VCQYWKKKPLQKSRLRSRPEGKKNRSRVCVCCFVQVLEEEAVEERKKNSSGVCVLNVDSISR